MGGASQQPVLVELIVGDDADSWSAAGFHVDGDSTRIGSVRVRFAGPEAGRGIRSWSLVPLPDGTDEVDGLPTHAPSDGVAVDPPTRSTIEHANGIVALDHVVVASPDLDRTLERLTDLGFDLRRTRDVGTPDRPRRQLFFWIGEPILELVGPAVPTGDGPSRFFGLACTATDLDATAAHLGDGCGRVKDAVQPGRRIATLRHESFGMSVPVALMTPHVDPAASP